MLVIDQAPFTAMGQADRRAGGAGPVFDTQKVKPGELLLRKLLDLERLIFAKSPKDAHFARPRCLLDVNFEIVTRKVSNAYKEQPTRSSRHLQEFFFLIPRMPSGNVKFPADGQ